MRRLLPLVLFATRAAAGPQCEPFCSEPCDVLNGDIAHECGACSETAAGCRPGAAGWRGGSVSPVDGDAHTSNEVIVDVAGSTDVSVGSGSGRRSHDGQQTDGGWPNQAGGCDEETEQQVHAALAELAALPEETFWGVLATTAPACGAADDLSALRLRGYAVVRQLISEDALARANAVMPAVDRVSETKRFASETFSRSQLQSDVPEILASMENLVQDWDSRGLLPPSQQSAAATAVGGYQYIRTDPTTEVHWCPSPCLGKWHVDPSGSCPRLPKLSVMVHRDRNSDWEHSNIVLAPTQSIVALGEAARRANATTATDATGGEACEPQHSDDASCRAQREAQPVWDLHQRRALAQSATATATQGSIEEQGGAMPPRRELALEHVSCVVKLEPGDALFFAGDLYHRTQDTASARITLQATLGPRVWGPRGE